MNLQNNRKVGSLYSPPIGPHSWITIVDKLPFPIKRIFWTTIQKPDMTLRGKHAHKINKQVLICVQGNIKLTVTDLKGKVKEIDLGGDDYYYHANEEWLNYAPDWAYPYDSDEEESDCILLSLNSDDYDENDYIRHWHDFEAMWKKSK